MTRVKVHNQTKHTKAKKSKNVRQDEKQQSLSTCNHVNNSVTTYHKT